MRRAFGPASEIQKSEGGALPIGGHLAPGRTAAERPNSGSPCMDVRRLSRRVFSPKPAPMPMHRREQQPRKGGTKRHGRAHCSGRAEAYRFRCRQPTREESGRNRLGPTTATATTAHAGPTHRNDAGTDSGGLEGEVVGSFHGNLFLYVQELAPCPRLRMVAGASLSLSLSASV